MDSKTSVASFFVGLATWFASWVEDHGLKNAADLAPSRPRRRTRSSSEDLHSDPRRGGSAEEDLVRRSGVKKRKLGAREDDAPPPSSGRAPDEGTSSRPCRSPNEATALTPEVAEALEPVNFTVLPLPTPPARETPASTRTYICPINIQAGAAERGLYCAATRMLVVTGNSSARRNVMPLELAQELGCPVRVNDHPVEVALPCGANARCCGHTFAHFKFEGLSTYHIKGFDVSCTSKEIVLGLDDSMEMEFSERNHGTILTRRETVIGRVDPRSLRGFHPWPGMKGICHDIIDASGLAGL